MKYPTLKEHYLIEIMYHGTKNEYDIHKNADHREVVTSVLIVQKICCVDIIDHDLLFITNINVIDWQ